MKISMLDVCCVRDALLCEGYGRVQAFSYGGWRTDERPYVLILGSWRNPRTGNELVGGINLNRLLDPEVEELQYVLQKIIGPSRDLRNRYRRGRALAPGIFQRAYRTYVRSLIHSVTPDTLRFLSKQEKPKPGVGKKVEKEPEEKPATFLPMGGGEEMPTL